MFKKNAMLSFEKLQDFGAFYKTLKVQGRWKIQTGKMNDRGKVIENNYYAKVLRKIFMDKQLFRRNVSIAEIISFLDEYVFIERIINDLSKKACETIFSKIKLHLEYKIPFSKNRRIDMIFEYNKKILVVEFRLSMDFPNQSAMWLKKETELIIYKELLSNFIGEDYKILLYALIGMPEYHQNNIIEKNVVYNTTNVQFFTDYLLTFLCGQNMRPEEFDISRR